MCERNDLYRNVIAVTNRKLCGRPFLQQIGRVCEKRPAALILREKDLSEGAYRTLAEDVRTICDSAGVKLILHKYRHTALALGIHTIHLPLGDLTAMNGEDGADRGFFEEIGCSVHSVQEAHRAQQLGADYLIAGHIYPTDCKKDLPPRGLNFLREVCGAVSIPVYAIGGIHPDAALIRQVMNAGAAGACIMSAAMRL